MTTKSEIQALLRFLSQDAKLALHLAMSKIKELQDARLTIVEDIAKANPRVIGSIFTEEKDAKQVLNAAKRISKKRAAGDSGAISPAKRKKSFASSETSSPASLEASLALPTSNAEEEELNAIILYTNRAPLVLAFALMLLQYTMPSQPLSSRLSLAQAVVSVNSRSKAVSLGIEKGNSAEDEGWGQGQPIVKIMGRSIRVMKRWGYDPTEGSHGSIKSEASLEAGKHDNVKVEDVNEDSQSTVRGDEASPADEKPALWGLNLEALRKANGPPVSGNQDTSQLPIYTAQSARSYILKAFASESSETAKQHSPQKKSSAAALLAEKERNLGLLLRALELLYSSWVDDLSTEELDRRAWSCYVAVRPEVETGVAGWGGKGIVKLAQILDMRRKG